LRNFTTEIIGLDCYAGSSVDVKRILHTYVVLGQFINYPEVTFISHRFLSTAFRDRFEKHKLHQKRILSLHGWTKCNHYECEQVSGTIFHSCSGIPELIYPAPEGNETPHSRE